MAKVYAARIKKKAVESLREPPAMNAAYRIAKQEFEKAHDEMLKNFESHPVTREIEAGPTSENTSGSLGGYGNLFSFIGFSNSQRPVDIVRQFLKFRPKIFKRSRLIRGHNSTSYAFRVQIPTTEEIENIAPSPWGGRSWVRGIERGISGLGYFLYNRQGFAGSRSMTGIQSDYKVRSLAYRPVKYMSSILKTFRRKAISS